MIPWEERIFNVSILYFYENGFFSHIIYPEHSFPSHFILASSIFPLSQIHSSPIPCTKEQASKRQQGSMTKQDTVTQGKCPHIKARQGCSIGGKESQEQTYRLEQCFPSSFGLHVMFRMIIPFVGC